MPVRAFLFDFDGLIVDTEVPSRAGWQHVYAQHGHELTPEKWALVVGTVGAWDPMTHLEELVGEPLDHRGQCLGVSPMDGDVGDPVPLAPLLQLLDDLRDRPNDAIRGFQELLSASRHVHDQMRRPARVCG